jgi:hypothetical protein
MGHTSSGREVGGPDGAGSSGSGWGGEVLLIGPLAVGTSGRLSFSVSDQKPLQTLPAYQRQGLAAAGLAGLRAEHPGFAWHTLGGGHIDGSPAFWDTVRMAEPSLKPAPVTLKVSLIWCTVPVGPKDTQGSVPRSHK